MRIYVEFDGNWSDCDVEEIIRNKEITAKDLNIDEDDFFEALVVAAMMKKYGYEDSSEAMKAGHMSVENGIRDYFFDELMEDYMLYYGELLEEGLQESA